jgi:hypothetical protein
MHKFDFSAVSGSTVVARHADGRVASPADDQRAQSTRKPPDQAL